MFPIFVVVLSWFSVIFPIVFKWSWVIVRDLVNVDWLRCFSDLYSSQSCWVIWNNSDKYQGTITSTLKRPSGQKYKNLKYIQFYWIKPALFSQARQAWASQPHALNADFLLSVCWRWYNRSRAEEGFYIGILSDYHRRANQTSRAVKGQPEFASANVNTLYWGPFVLDQWNSPRKTRQVQIN